MLACRRDLFLQPCGADLEPRKHATSAITEALMMLHSAIDKFERRRLAADHGTLVPSIRIGAALARMSGGIGCAAG